MADQGPVGWNGTEPLIDGGDQVAHEKCVEVSRSFEKVAAASSGTWIANPDQYCGRHVAGIDEGRNDPDNPKGQSSVRTIEVPVTVEDVYDRVADVRVPLVVVWNMDIDLEVVSHPGGVEQAWRLAVGVSECCGRRFRNDGRSADGGRSADDRHRLGCWGAPGKDHY